jgi:hypothetical protein
MTTKPAGLSLADLNARKASEVAYEFEYLLPDGSGSGVFLSVVGTHSDTIMKASQELEDARRKREAVRAMKAAKARPDHVEVTPVSEDIDNGTRLVAKRIVAWRGITEPCTPENALTLCQTNPEVSTQVMEASNELGNFMRASSPAS